MNFFFIGGAPKSGTTWLQLSLDAHPQVTCSGEGHFHETVIRPISEIFEKFNRKMEKVGTHVYAGKRTYSNSSNAEIVPLARSFIEKKMIGRRCPTTTVCGDKTPGNANYALDFSCLFPEMKLIVMLRDPRDVAVSRLHHEARVARKDIAALDFLSWVNRSALAWKAEYDGGRTFAKLHPHHTHFVKYEDMLLDFRNALTDVLKFLDVSSDPSIVREIEHKTRFDNLSGRDRGVEDRTSFFRKGVVGDGVTSLDRASIDLILSHCGQGMEEFGYV